MGRWIFACVWIVAVACSSSDDPAPVATEDVGTSGGTVEVAEGSLAGASVEVPAGALSATATITIGAGSGVNAGTDTMGVGPAVRFDSDGPAFTSPVTVTVPFSTTQAGGKDVSVAQRNDITGAVTIHSSPTISGGMASVQVTSFSTFQAFVDAPASVPTYDMTGTWGMSFSNNFSDPAGEEDPDETIAITVTQTGNSVTVVAGDGGGAAGTVSGSTYTLSVEEQNGDLTYTEQIVFTLSSANSGSGTTRWQDTDGDGMVVLSGGGDVTFTRNAPATYDMSGTWNLSFSNNYSVPSGEEDPDETVAITVMQTGNSVTITDVEGSVSGTVAGATYTVNVEEDLGGGLTYTQQLVFTLVSADAGSGTTTWEETDAEDTVVLSGGGDLTFTREQ